MPRTTVVFCAFDPVRSAKSWPLCLFLKQKSRNMRLVVVANSAGTQRMQFPGSTARIEGSNVDREWSAYDEGAAAVSGELGAEGGIMFLNDTACEHPLTEAAAIAFLHRIRMLQGACILGFENRAPFSEQGEVLLGRRVHGWISTWWFYLSKPALDRLGGLSSDVEEVLPGRAETGTELLSRLPPQMAGFLDWYLFGTGAVNAEPYRAGGRTYRHGWKGRAPLTQENFAFFRQKVGAVLQEYLLTARVREWGKVVDIRKAEPCAYLIHRHYVERAPMSIPE